MNSRALRRVTLAVLGFAVLPGLTSAHDRTTSYSSWRISTQRAKIVLTLNEADAESLKLADREDALDQYAMSRLALLADGKPCAVASPLRRLATSAGRIRFEWSVAIPANTALDIRSDLFAEGGSGHLHFASLHQTQTDGVTERVLTSAERSWRIESNGSFTLEKTMPIRFIGYMLVGVEHILSGYDHLVFLFVLLLSGGTFRALVRVITGFTVGHSITLGLAVLGVIRPQSAQIEALIGLSIVLVAVENVWLLGRTDRLLPVTTISLLAVLGGFANAGFGRIPALCWFGMVVFLSCYYPLLHRSAAAESARWVVALIFGLVHGFAFASVLQEAEVTADRLVGALLGFNLGVEAGQIAVVAVAWPMLCFAMARWRDSVIEVGSAVALLFGVYWMAGRNYL